MAVNVGRIRVVGLVCFSMSLFVSCGRWDSSGAQSTPPPAMQESANANTMPVEPKPVESPVFLAFLGGKGSCDSFPTIEELRSRKMPAGYFESFGNLLVDLEAKMVQKPHYLISCLPFDGTPETAQFNYFTNFDEAEAGILEARTGNLNALEDSLRLASANAGRVYLIGHSYGGWTAMKLAPSIARSKKLSMLMTVDPISAVTCTPVLGVMDYFESGSVEGCNHAPDDFGEMGLQEIKNSADSWVNVYQTANAYLHSSQISHAGENIEIPFSPVTIVGGLLKSLFQRGNPHYFVLVDPQPWAKLSNAILESSTLTASVAQ